MVTEITLKNEIHRTNVTSSFELRKMDTGDSNCITKYKEEKVIHDLPMDRNVTDEEFQNFMQRVTEVEKIVKKLTSKDEMDQEEGKQLADQILHANKVEEISETVEIRVKNERTIINRVSELGNDSKKNSREAFMRSVEKDAKERAEDRKRRNELAETYKRIANGAFSLKDYEKAITYYSKAVEERKDSALLWNNRGLAYMRLGLYESALADLEWALKVNRTNIKALLNSAKCYSKLSNIRRCDEFIALARELHPNFTGFINDFEKTLKNGICREDTEN